MPPGGHGGPTEVQFGHLLKCPAYLIFYECDIVKLKSMVRPYQIKTNYLPPEQALAPSPKGALKHDKLVKTGAVLLLGPQNSQIKMCVFSWLQFRRCHKSDSKKTKYDQFLTQYASRLLQPIYQVTHTLQKLG